MKIITLNLASKYHFVKLKTGFFRLWGIVYGILFCLAPVGGYKKMRDTNFVNVPHVK